MKENTIRPDLNRPETKERYFSNHFGCEFINRNGLNEVVSGSMFLREAAKGGVMLLTSLADITDEDAIEVAKIIHGKEDKLRFRVSLGYERDNGVCTHESVVCVEVSQFIPYPGDSRYYLHQLIQFDTEENDIIVGKFSDDGAELSDDHGDNILHAYDHLRSRGYALSWMGYTVEELIAAGYCQLRKGGE